MFKIIPYFKEVIKKKIPQPGFLQRFYLGIYYFGLWGMNYGGTPKLRQSGESKALEILKSQMSECPTILDVGANKGDYSLILNEFYPAAQIHAFEPVKAVFDELVINTENIDNITTHNLGLGDTNEILEISLESKSTHNSLVRLEKQKGHNQLKEKVRIIKLDDFVSNTGIETIDFLKIDVEGFELNVLKGAEKLLKSKSIKVIQFEFGGTMIDARVFLRDFYSALGNDYNLFRITKRGLYPLGVYQPHYEIFHYCNYVAIISD